MDTGHNLMPPFLLEYLPLTLQQKNEKGKKNPTNNNLQAPTLWEVICTWHLPWIPDSINRDFQACHLDQYFWSISDFIKTDA